MAVFTPTVKLRTTVDKERDMSEERKTAVDALRRWAQAMFYLRSSPSSTPTYSRAGDQFSFPVPGRAPTKHIEEIHIPRTSIRGEPFEILKDLEICICAAIQFDDGRVIRGHRHHDCFHTAERMGLTGKLKQGFVTSRNRFVDRTEGYTLQHAAGVTSADPNGYRGTLLFSEDLY